MFHVSDEVNAWWRAEKRWREKRGRWATFAFPGVPVHSRGDASDPHGGVVNVESGEIASPMTLRPRRRL